jgi:putative NADH-flavin reductase
MKIAIFGATGKTGGHAMRLALEAGHHVRALARDPAKLATKHDELEIVKGDATKAEDCARAVEGCDAVIAALGPPGLGATTLRQDAAKALTSAMKATGAKKIVWLSALGVGENMAQARKTSLLATLFMKSLLRKTYVDADAAEHVLRGSGVDYVICRPPELTNRAARGHVDEVPEDQKLPRLSIPRADVAAWMLKAAGDGHYARQAVTIC